MSDCICKPPVRNDIAWHHPVCPWRIREIERLRERWGRR